jgi:hypothetical protein
VQIFGVPPRARRAKPFIDHILTFAVVDGKIWFRNFQVGSGVSFYWATFSPVPPRLWRRTLLIQTGLLLLLSSKSARGLCSPRSEYLKGRLGEQLYIQTPVSLIQASNLRALSHQGLLRVRYSCGSTARRETYGRPEVSRTEIRRA